MGARIPDQGIGRAQVLDAGAVTLLLATGIGCLRHEIAGGRAGGDQLREGVPRPAQEKVYRGRAAGGVLPADAAGGERGKAWHTHLMAQPSPRRRNVWRQNWFSKRGCARSIWHSTFLGAPNACCPARR